MGDMSALGYEQHNPEIWDYKRIGTAAGTTTILSQPGRLGAIFVDTRVASGVITIYDSVGTSGTVIGTITMGTQGFSDAPAPYWILCRTLNGLTVVNTANQGCMVLYK